METKTQNIPVIELRHIGKSYHIGEEKIDVLSDINLQIKRKEFVSIMGSSGAGKSTLMNILGCLDRPTVGSYLLDGDEVSTLSDNELAYTRNKKIGFIFQSFNLLPRLSAVDNVILPMIYGKIFKKERRERAEKILKSVGLGDRMNHMPAELSGGQRQRVAIARALVNNPAIIMADEPTGNLDSGSTKEIMDIFTELSDIGKTIILVTHEDDVALYARRHIILSDGKISHDTEREER